MGRLAGLVAMLGMLLVPSSIMRSLAVGAILASLATPRGGSRRLAALATNRVLLA